MGRKIQVQVQGVAREWLQANALAVGRAVVGVASGELVGMRVSQFAVDVLGEPEPQVTDLFATFALTVQPGGVRVLSPAGVLDRELLEAVGIASGGSSGSGSGRGW